MIFYSDFGVEFIFDKSKRMKTIVFTTKFQGQLPFHDRDGNEGQNLEHKYYNSFQLSYAASKDTYKTANRLSTRIQGSLRYTYSHSKTLAYPFPELPVEAYVAKNSFIQLDESTNVCR